MFSELCDRWPSSTTFPSKRWVTSTLFQSGSRPRFAESNAVVNFVPLVGAWSRKPKGNRKARAGVAMTRT
jgi:hypothetical protein